MLQTAQRGKKTSANKAAPHERFLEAFRWMLLARTLEEKLVSLYRGGQITGGVYIGKGQEAVSVACGMFLQKGDIFAPLIRDQAGRSAFGEPIVDVARTYLGSRQGPMRGRDGNIHRGKPGDDQLAMISHLGAMVSVTVGASVLRLSGHGEHDDASYVTDEMKRQPFAQDCLKLTEKKVVDLEMADAATLKSWREDAARQVDEAIATAQKEAAPDAEKEDWCAISTRELVDRPE